MERNKILEIVREEIFEKMHEFNNDIEVIDDVREDSNLSSDLAMDPFDLLEVLIGIEEKMDIRIPDDVFGDKSIVGKQGEDCLTYAVNANRRERRTRND